MTPTATRTAELRRRRQRADRPRPEQHAAGIQNAIQGGNEQQAVTLAGFNPDGQSFQISINGVNTSPSFGAGGSAISNANLAAAINAHRRLRRRRATVNGSGNAGFNVTFAGAPAGTDVPAISIVNCTSTCTSFRVRTTAKGGNALSSWPAGAYRRAVGTRHRRRLHADLQRARLAGKDVDAVHRSPTRTARRHRRARPRRAPRAILPGRRDGHGRRVRRQRRVLDDSGFQVTFGGTLAGRRRAGARRRLDRRRRLRAARPPTAARSRTWASSSPTRATTRRSSPRPRRVTRSRRARRSR